MNRLLYFLAIAFLFLSACSDKEKQKNNEKYILGDWVKIPNRDTLSDGDIIIEPQLFKIGFSFLENHIFESKSGFFKYLDKKNSLLFEDFIPPQYLGNRSKFTITDDSLKFYSLSKKSWEGYKILTLNNDTLIVRKDSTINTFLKLKSKLNKTPSFDKIILSTSACFGPCPILQIIISTKGDVVFYGQNFTSKKGIYSGKITKAEYEQLQNNFRKTDFSVLKNKYEAGATDLSTTTTTFLKGDTIYKTVSDYGGDAPTQFVWAYEPLVNLYQTIKLSPLKYPEYMSSLHSLLAFQKGDQIFGLAETEKFLFQYYLMNGKISTFKFKPRFKIQAFKEPDLKGRYNILTDGRYFTLISNGKPVTIDIGFNFYDVNKGHWKWGKIRE